MQTADIEAHWPNALRWFLSQDLHHFAPWRLLEKHQQFEFHTESVEDDGPPRKGTIFVFARRDDNGDFAGLQMVDGIITERVICFHPLIPTHDPNQGLNVVSAIYENVFDFVAYKIIDDMKQQAQQVDASELGR